jgi:tripartite-type tricarboxylate transporter receptor subunit TctC
MKKLLPALATLLIATSAIAAQCPSGFPSKPIRLIVPFPAGGTSDIVARIMSERLGAQMGQSWVVENRAGGGAAIGITAVVNAPADGYTLLLGAAGPISMSPHIAKLPYDVEAQLIPLALVAAVPNLVAVNPSVPANTLTELIKLMRDGGKQMNYGSAGYGTTANFAGELFKSLTKTEMTHVPYKGTSAAIIDLVSGHIDLAIDNLPALLPHVKTGKLKALAVTSDIRSPAASAIPTAAEAGLKDFLVSGWFGFLAPRNTPTVIVACLADRIVRVAHEPDIQKRFEQAGAQPDVRGAKEFSDYIRKENIRWAEVARVAKIRMD